MNAWFNKSVVVAAGALVLAGVSMSAQAQSFSEGFNGSVVPTGWTLTNNSTRASTGSLWSVAPGILDSTGAVVVPAFEGDTYALVNYTSVGSGTGTISNWLISPEIFGIQNGDTFSFYTTTTPSSAYPDRLEFRLSSAGAGVDVGTTVTSVGSFSTVLATVNSGLTVGGYPTTWTQVTATVSGLAAPIDGRVAFRYFVTSGGPSGANSNIIGVDAFSYTSVSAVPEPATWAMAAIGLMGLVTLRRQRRD